MEAAGTSQMFLGEAKVREPFSTFRFPLVFCLTHGRPMTCTTSIEPGVAGGGCWAGLTEMKVPRESRRDHRIIRWNFIIKLSSLTPEPGQGKIASRSGHACDARARKIAAVKWFVSSKDGCSPSPEIPRVRQQAIAFHHRF